DQKRAAELQRLLREGQAALQAKQWDLASTSFLAAKKLAPTNVDVLAGLSQAQQAREASLVEARRRQEAQQRQVTIQKPPDGGKRTEATPALAASPLTPPSLPGQLTPPPTVKTPTPAQPVPQPKVEPPVKPLQPPPSASAQLPSTASPQPKPGQPPPATQTETPPRPAPQP